MSVSGGTTEKTTSKANINPVDIYNLVRGFSPSNINVGNKKLRVPTKNRFLTIASFYFNTCIKSSTNISFEKSKNCVNLHFILVFSRAQLLRVSWRPGHRLNTRTLFCITFCLSAGPHLKSAIKTVLSVHMNGHKDWRIFTSEQNQCVSLNKSVDLVYCMFYW